MHLAELKQTVTIPEGVTAEIKGPMLSVKGPKGDVTKKIGSKLFGITIADNKVVFMAKNATRREKRLMNTGRAHARNMLRGVTEGHVYKLKICSGHFPMSVAVKDGVFEVKNFIGEKVPRRLQLKEGVKVEVKGDQVIVEGPNRDLTGNQAAAIELLTRRPGFDTRIFQDGIFITEKDGRHV